MIETKKSILAILAGLGVLAAYFFANQLLAGQLLSVQYIVFLFLGLAMLLIVLNPNYRILILGAAMAAMALGWRGLALVAEITLYPTEILVLLSFMVFVVGSIFHRTSDKPQYIPYPAWILLGSSLLGIVTGLANQHVPGYVILEAKSFMIFFPMLVIVKHWVNRETEIYRYVKVLVVTGAIIAGLGLVGYYVPAVANLFPAYFSQTAYERLNFETGSIVRLADYSSWGTPVVAVFLVLPLGLSSIPITKGKNKLLWLACSTIIALGIIVSGYRSAWLGAAVTLAGLSLFMKQKWAIIFISILLIGGSALFSQGYLDRAASIFDIQHSTDPSVIRRQNALTNSILTISQHPLTGTGWQSPVAFNDWIYIGVSQGVIGMLVFFAWYVVLFWKLAKSAFHGKWKDEYLSIGFLVSLAGYAVSMVSGAMSQVLPLWSGFWLVFCLAWRYSEIHPSEQIETNGKNIHTTASL